MANNVAVVRELVGPGRRGQRRRQGRRLRPRPASRSRACSRAAGADRLCVASLDEALALRDAGITLPILVLFPIPAAEVVRAARGAHRDRRVRGVTRRLPASRQWAAIACNARRRTQVAPRGRDRLVARRRDSRRARRRRIARLIIDTPGRRLAGLWTHLASPERRVGDRRAARASSRRPLRLIARRRASRATAPPRGDRRSVRPAARRSTTASGSGLACTGLLPLDLPIADQPAAIRRAAATGHGAQVPSAAHRAASRRARAVGYGGRWTAERESVIATLPVGYADGFVRAYSAGRGGARPGQARAAGRHRRDGRGDGRRDRRCRVSGIEMSSYCWLARWEQNRGKRAGAWPQHHSVGGRNEHVSPITPGVPCRLGTNGAPHD